MSTQPAAHAGALPLRLHRDHLYIEANVFDAHLPNIRSVALIRQGNDLLIFPIAAAEAGGFVVKHVNIRGDRAIHAADFFRLAGIDDALDVMFDAHFNTTIAGFIVSNLFAVAQAHSQTNYAIRK